MKQMRFILIALLTVVMGMSVTSCMKGDDNPIRDLSVIAKLGSYGSTYFVMMDGMKIVPTDVSSVMMLDPGMYIVNGQYNVNELSNSAVNLTLTLPPTNIDGTDVTDRTPVPNAPFYALEYGNQINGYYPYLFDKTTVIVPLMFWVKETLTAKDAEAELKKHAFTISYEEAKEGDTELVLNVSHVITEDKAEVRNKFTINHQAYDLSYAINSFKSKGNTLNKIVFKAKVNTQENKLENSRDEDFEIDYSKIKD